MKTDLATPVISISSLLGQTTAAMVRFSSLTQHSFIQTHPNCEFTLPPPCFVYSYCVLNSGLRPFRSDSSGLLTAVHKDYFRVVNYRELLFNDCGDRVAQLLHVELAVPFSHCRNNDIRQEILIVNTHLLFPHDSSLCLVRLNQVGALMAVCIYATSYTFQFQRFLNLFFQVYKILQYVESYQKENKLNPMPIILCG